LLAALPFTPHYYNYYSNKKIIVKRTGSGGWRPLKTGIKKKRKEETGWMKNKIKEFYYLDNKKEQVGVSFVLFACVTLGWRRVLLGTS
jgi:hypothetical protein